MSAALSTSILLALAAAPDDAEASADAEVALGEGNAEGDAEATSDNEGRAREDKWIHRHAPTRNMGEIGIFAGVFLPTPRLELFQADDALPQQGYRPFRAANPDIGLRAAYFPIRFLGVELEGAAMPSKLKDGGKQRATMFAFRGHVVGQLGLWSVTPFVLLGTGLMGVASDRNAVGKDVDISIHFGGGVKIFATDDIMVRLDLRDNVSARRGVENGLGHSGEILLGLSYTPRSRKKKAVASGPRDRDGDGFLDDEDQCPTVPGIAPDGCPRSDRDGDGFFDDEDKCPDEPGVEPDGCPRPDKDGDKIADEVDKCIDVPEVKNGFEDTDGCPDELPKEVADFAGVIKGIEFDLDKDTIKSGSRKVLDKAVAVLAAHPEIAVEIGGHTDSTGSREYNLDLSRRRAKSVRDYLVGKGIAEDRVSTRGYGPDQPIATNETTEGRARNRRIEFTVRKD